MRGLGCRRVLVCRYGRYEGERKGGLCILWGMARSAIMWGGWRADADAGRRSVMAGFHAQGSQAWLRCWVGPWRTRAGRLCANAVRRALRVRHLRGVNCLCVACKDCISSLLA